MISLRSFPTAVNLFPINTSGYCYGMLMARQHQNHNTLYFTTITHTHKKFQNLFWIFSLTSNESFPELSVINQFELWYSLSFSSLS